MNETHRLSQLDLTKCERIITHPDTYKRVRISEVSDDIVKRADELLALDEAFRELER